MKLNQSTCHLDVYVQESRKAKAVLLSINAQGTGVPTAGQEVRALKKRGESAMWQLELGPGLRAALALEGLKCCVRLSKWPSKDG